MNLKTLTISSALKFSTSEVLCKIIPKKSKGSSSEHWLRRQLNDPFVELAKVENYRCRSAFKLLEIDSRHKLFKPGQCVVDCGASPGSWTQVAANKTNANWKNRNLPIGNVISIDRLAIHPVEGAKILGNLDFTTPAALTKLNETLNGKLVDVVLSDMAPNATGVKSMDHDQIIMLGYSVLRFAVQVSSVGASLVVKLWDGSSTEQFFKDLSTYYNLVHHIKPKASHMDSSELFLLAKEFKGLKT